MNKLVEEIIKPILESNPKIKKIVGIYGGRFQPFGPHHLKTYKWLTKQVDDAYITTSNIKKPPRHPMNFKEKVRHMSKMGVPSSKISVEKTPYVAKNLEKKYNSETTAFVYVFGKKDAGRLGSGTNKSGKPSYYQDFKKNKKNLQGYETHGYVLVAPHVSISVGGKEVSGTAMRELLGSNKYDDKERAKLFKKMFGYYDKGVFNMMTNKFKKLFKEGSGMSGGIGSNPGGGHIPGSQDTYTGNVSTTSSTRKNSIKGAYKLKKKKKKKKKNEDVDMVFKPTSMEYEPKKKRKLKKKFRDGKDKELLKGQMDEDWFKKGSKKDRALKLQISKLYTKAFKMMPGSPNQKKIQKEIEKLRNQLSENVDLPIKVGDIVKMGRFKNKKVVVKSIDWNEKGDLLINGRPALKFRISKSTNEGYPNEEDMKKIEKRVAKAKKDSDEVNKLTQDLVSDEKYQYHTIEGVEKVNKDGKDGGEYRKYNPEEESDWEQPAKGKDSKYLNYKKMKKEDIEEFLTLVDFRKIIEESTLSTAGSVDDGPNIFAPNGEAYKHFSKQMAGKLGWEILDYVLGDNSDLIPPKDFRIYPDGPVGSVSFLPAGVGVGATANNRADLVGTPAWNTWIKHMNRVASLTGYTYVDLMTNKEDAVGDSKETKDVMTKEEPRETSTKRKDIQKESLFTKDWWKEVLTEDERMNLDEGIKFTNFLKDWSKKSKQPLSKVKKSMNNKNTFSIAKLNDFSVDKVFESAKSGFKTYQKIINYLPDKISKGLEKTKFGEKKTEFLKKVDGYLEKNPRIKRMMGVAAGAAITYAWTKMTFVGDPEYDLDLSGAASAAAAGDYTMSDLFSGELGTKFLVLTAIGAGTGLTAPYTKVLGNIGTFAAGIGFGAYRAYKKHNTKKQDKENEKFKGLPDKVKNPNPDGKRKEVKVQTAVSWISKNKGNKASKKYMRNLRTRNMKESFSKDWWKEQLLTEGGAYGHMAHPFDDKDLTFGDLKKIIELGLGGNLSREDNVTEKLDGQNIMVSWKDGKLIAARNKGHIKNGGATALDTKGIMSKFKGRGDIRNAFVFAMKDLEKAIKKLSQKQKDKIFNNGYNFMNMEVMWPKSSNVIDYDKAELVFHGALKYNDKGNVIGEVPGSGRMLQGMIRQINQHIQKKYKIGKPVFLDVPKHQDFGKMKSKFLGRLSKLKHRYGLKDNDTLALYHQHWWEQFISNNYSRKLSGKVVEGLTKRWAFFDKSYSVADIKKDMKSTDFFDEKVLESILSFDKKDHAKQVKENMRPFEVLFFEVGAEILKNVKGFMAANPDKAVQNMKKKLSAAIKDVQSGGDLKKLNRLKTQLDRFKAIGGSKSIVPSEGIVFKYKGKTYKFTGAFAPVNQITGLMSF